jgi:nitrogen-specific signal transduction histidine kinase
MSMNPILDDEGKSSGALAMVTDLTEARKLQEQLMVSDRMASIGTMAAGVAHEINNPLAAALANLQLGVEDTASLVERLPEAGELKEVHEGLVDALEATERVRSIVRDLKIFSRSQEEEREAVDLRRVVESSLRMAWTEIKHRAKVVKKLDPVPPVLANESRLGQVCLNLLVNAAQAIEEGHLEANQITVSTYVDGRGQAVIEIRDTGAGMTPDVLRKLFTPFFTTKPAGIGTGLGLSICHRIISSLGGEIAVESTVGKGTTFRISLQPEPSAEVVIPDSGRATEEKTRKGRILVIDDEPLILNTVRRSLAEHDVTTTTSAREALERITLGERYDVILCDLVMPHVTGMDLYTLLRDLDREQARSVIFLTSGTFTPRARAFLEEVDNPVVEKPFDQVKLRKIVNDRIR